MFKRDFNYCITPKFLYLLVNKHGKCFIIPRQNLTEINKCQPDLIEFKYVLNNEICERLIGFETETERNQVREKLIEALGDM